MTPDWVAKTASTQKAMLKKALTLLSAGHEMVYSTCSILQEENEDVLKAVLPAMNAEIVPIEHEFLQHAPLLPVTMPWATAGITWCSKIRHRAPSDSSWAAASST